MTTDKLHIYFMPGLAASSRIFEHISMPEDRFVLHFLEWLEPGDENEHLSQYASRYVDLIGHPRPVLIGVSFGGILVQEIGKMIEVSHLIIISSIKSRKEMPKRLKFIKMTRAYRIFPSKRLSKIDDFSKYEFHPKLKNKGELYNKYLSIRNEKYLNWAIRNVLYWHNSEHPTEVTHIHGTKDEIFPYKYINGCIPVEGGTHAMIITKAKRISGILEELLT
jgi:pimeloyl-ACP methyl ester carboxylesterase